MTIHKKPEIINISSTELEEVKFRLKETTLTEQDKKIILSILSTYQWLSKKMNTAKFTMHRLKQALGFSTEKFKNRKETKAQNSEDLFAPEEPVENPEKIGDDGESVQKK